MTLLCFPHRQVRSRKSLPTCQSPFRRSPRGPNTAAQAAAQKATVNGESSADFASSHTGKFDRARACRRAKVRSDGSRRTRIDTTSRAAGADKLSRPRRRRPRLVSPIIRPFPKRCPLTLNPSTSARTMAAIAPTSCAGITPCGNASIKRGGNERAASEEEQKKIGAAHIEGD